MPAKPHIRIIWIASGKKAFIEEGCGHYTRLLGRYCYLEFVPIRQKKNSSMEEDTQQILSRVKDHEKMIVLDAGGHQEDSIGFAKMLERFREEAKPVCVVIGPAFGLSGEIKKKADVLLSLSDQTYTHQLVRLMLLEQLYRGFSIIHGHPFSK